MANDADIYQRTIRRVIRLIVIIGLLGSLAASIVKGPRFGAGFLFFGALALLGFLGLAMVKVRWRTTWGAVSGARV